MPTTYIISLSNDFTSTCWGSMIAVTIEIPIIDLKRKRKDKLCSQLL